MGRLHTERGKEKTHTPRLTRMETRGNTGRTPVFDCCKCCRVSTLSRARGRIGIEHKLSAACLRLTNARALCQLLQLLHNVVVSWSHYIPNPGPKPACNAKAVSCPETCPRKGNLSTGTKPWSALFPCLFPAVSPESSPSS